MLPEAEYVKIAIDSLNFELRKKFEGITFIDLFKLRMSIQIRRALKRRESKEKLFLWDLL
jgi:hypothetical protein